MRIKTLVFLTVCAIFSFCSVVSNPVLRSEHFSKIKSKNVTDEMKIPSYEKSIEFLVPKNTTAKIFSNNTLNNKNLNDSLKDEVLNEKEANKKGKIDERSFIFIEQRYKVPVHHRHSVQHPHGKVQNYRTFISNHNHDELIDNSDFANIDPHLIIDDFSTRFEEYKIQPALTKSYFLDNVNSYQPRRTLDNESDDMKDKVQTANEIMRKQYQKTMGVKSKSKSKTADSASSQQYHPLNVRHKTKSKQENVSDDHREFVELLKPPLVRAGANCDSNSTNSNDIDDGVYEDNAIPKHNIKISRPFSNYGFIRPFAISRGGDDFQMARDNDSNEKLHSDDVTDALQTADDKNIEVILKEHLEKQTIHRKPYSQDLLARICKNHPQKINPQCQCAKIEEIPSKPNEETNEKPTPQTASENYIMSSPLRLIRGPDSDENNNTASTEKSQGNRIIVL